jgi:hypothetical protein
MLSKDRWMAAEETCGVQVNPTMEKKGLSGRGRVSSGSHPPFWHRKKELDFDLRNKFIKFSGTWASPRTPSSS